MKVTANIATYPPRKDSLKQMLESIKGQFDEVNIYWNQCENCDEVYNYISEQFKTTVTTTTGNLTDNGKFYRLDTLTEHEYYFTLDDDLIYPPDYVAKTIEAIEEYGCIIAHHGRQLLSKQAHYYRGHKCFRCLDDVDTAEMLDVAGTGVTAFRTDYFHPKGLANHKLQRMSDLIFSLEAAKQGKTIGIVPHKHGWIKPIFNKESIFDTEMNNGIAKQNELANEIFTLKYE